MDATLAICTCNGADRIGSVLDSLRAQQCGALWEVLVVDNASTDGVADTVAALAADFPVSLHVVVEPRPGLSFARACAGQEAGGDIVCFLDDDSPAEPGFTEAAIRFFREHPRAGVAGGKVVPEWTDPPTPLAEIVSDFALALNDRGDAAFAYQGITEAPAGAGLCIRTHLLREIYGEPGFMAAVTGRRGTALTSGDDTALCVRVRQLDWEAWYAPALRCRHRIGAERMTFEYLARLYAGIGRGQAAVRRLHDTRARHPVWSKLIAGRDFCRWLRGLTAHWRRARREEGDLARSLHALRQRQTLARACAGWRTRS